MQPRRSSNADSTSLLPAICGASRLHRSAHSIFWVPVPALVRSWWQKHLSCVFRWTQICEPKPRICRWSTRIRHTHTHTHTHTKAADLQMSIFVWGKKYPQPRSWEPYRRKKAAAFRGKIPHLRRNFEQKPVLEPPLDLFKHIRCLPLAQFWSETTQAAEQVKQQTTPTQDQGRRKISSTQGFRSGWLLVDCAKGVESKEDFIQDYDQPLLELRSVPLWPLRVFVTFAESRLRIGVNGTVPGKGHTTCTWTQTNPWPSMAAPPSHKRMQQDAKGQVTLQSETELRE